MPHNPGDLPSSHIRSPRGNLILRAYASVSPAPGLLAAPGDTSRWQAHTVDRLSEHENLRRSIAMANPRTPALDREEAMAPLRELQDVERRLWALSDGLRRLLDDEP